MARIDGMVLMHQRSGLATGGTGSEDSLKLSSSYDSWH